MREELETATLEPAPRATSTTILAFDFGTEHVGAAVGDSAIGIAHPLMTIAAADKKGRYTAIASLVLEWRPALLVVGLPAHLDGTEHEMSRLARKFARELNGRFNLPVELVDERLTSASAESSLAETGVDTRKRKPLIDQVAAQQILQAYLDVQARRRRTAESRP